MEYPRGNADRLGAPAAKRCALFLPVRPKGRNQFTMPHLHNNTLFILLCCLAGVPVFFSVLRGSGRAQRLFRRRQKRKGD